MKKKSKIIQVPVPEDLLRELDELSQKRGESRSAVIREACAKYVTSLEENDLDRQYIEGYARMREKMKGRRSLEERIAESQMAMLSEILPDQGRRDEYITTARMPRRQT